LDKIQKKLAKGNSVFVGVPLRLGIDKITREYLTCLKEVYNFESNLGIAGGQDHKSLYFVGIVNAHVCSDPKLIYLDPHFVQEAHTTMTVDALETYSCQEVNTLSLSKICTSVCIGFYLKDGEAFEKFSTKLKAVARIDHSIFSVYEKSPTFSGKSN
jgi:hypothetical protein